MIKFEIISNNRNLLLCVLIFICSVPIAAQNVGINTTTPLASLHVDLGASLSSGILFTGLDPSGGSFPSLGAGHRLMYYPGRGVFRAGYVEDTQWDNSQVGAFSFAFGYNPIAKGNGSTAIGDAVYAGGTISTAFGNSTQTKGYSSFVMGMYNDPLITGPDQDVETPQTPLLMVGNGDGNGTRNNALAVFKNGDVLLRNYSTVLSDPGVKLPPVTGPGTRMMWLAEKSAFRLGTVHNDDWNADSIGTWSTGIGYSTKAKGEFSLALGLQTTASGITSTALGYSTRASGENSISTGSVTIASGAVSTAMGSGTLASGITSTALGYSTVASGENSIAIGSVTSALGANSTSIGFKTYAGSYGSVSLGRYNDTIVNSNRTAWIGSDPMLILGNGTSDEDLHNAMVVYKNGNMVLKNQSIVTTDPGALPVPIIGPGTRLMWLPEKSAIRIGTVHNNDWDADSTGTWSTGIGYSTKAKGQFSLALGLQTTASGTTATAMGYSTTASGENSMSMGSVSIATGPVATAMGFDTRSTGFASTSMGFNTKSNALASTAMGSGSIANGVQSTAMGSGSIANGVQSTAMGFESRALGNISNASGLNSIAKGYASTVIGLYNDSILLNNQTIIDPQTPLFIVGNGDGFGVGQRKNAMVVRKDGHVSIGTGIPVNSALLELNSTTRGFLPPRMTFQERNTIAGPEAGLTIWCNNCGVYGQMQVYNGIVWTTMAGGYAVDLPNVGDRDGGGVIAYIFQPGDPGWVIDEIHGLIAVPEEYAFSIVTSWGCIGTNIPGAGGTALLTGSQNTLDIITGCSTSGIAADYCSDLNLGGYTDWYLPSKDELDKLYINRYIIGGFEECCHWWSSSEFDENKAWSQDFSSGVQSSTLKNFSARFRAVRSF